MLAKFGNLPNTFRKNSNVIKAAILALLTKRYGAQWSIERPYLMLRLKLKSLISVECAHFNTNLTDFPSNLLVSREWSIERPYLMLRLKLKSLISVECAHFNTNLTDFPSNLLVSRELLTEGYQGKPMKCAHFTHFKLKCAHFIERPLPGMVILWLQISLKHDLTKKLVSF